MADLNGTVSGGQKITGTVEPQAQKLRGALRLGGGGGGVTDVWQNGESVLDGTIGKVTVPTNTSDLTNDSGFITTETDPVFGASAAKNITASNISTWNGKQDALVSGTNIKTVNNTSLLGSGNVAVQETLVSGTNIKTINGNSLLGSGNIVIQGGGGSTVSYTQTQTSGNELGTITIDGTASKIYSPTETDPTVPSWAKASSKPSYTASEVGAVPTSRTVNGKALSSNIILSASDVGAQTAITSQTVSISVANWNATTTCTKSVTGVTSSNNVIVTPAPASINTWNSNDVSCAAQGSGTLTFTASTTPSADMIVNVMIIN